MQIKLKKLVPRPVESLLEFRAALGQFATGITIITCCYKGIPMGIVANSFASVSMDPPLVLWSPAKVSRRYNAFITAQNYSIHILSNKQKHICDAFSEAADAFDGLDWKTNKDGVPILSNCLARIDCHQYAQYPGGDHTIIVGHVDFFDYTAGEPLIFQQGNFSNIKLSKASTDQLVATKESAAI